MKIVVEWNKYADGWWFDVGLEICPSTRFIRIALTWFTIYIYSKECSED